MNITKIWNSLCFSSKTWNWNLLTVTLYVWKIFCDGNDQSEQCHKGSDESHRWTAGQIDTQFFYCMNTQLNYLKSYVDAELDNQINHF